MAKKIALTLWLLCFLNVCWASPPLEVVFLGTGGPRPAGRAASCNLILVQGKPRLFVDVGSGAFTRLGELGLRLTDVDLILLTHLHIDHTADLPSMIKARASTQDKACHFQVIGPSGHGDYPSTTRFNELLFGPGGAWTYIKNFAAPVVVDAQDLPNDPSAPPTKLLTTNDGVVVYFVSTHHGDAPAVAYRIEYSGKSVTFSGDIDPLGLDNLTKLAQKTDLLVFNCAVLDPPGSPAELYTRHSPPKRIGQVAKAAGVKRLILTHIPPVVDKAEGEVTHSIDQSANAPVTFAQDALRVPVE
jgi:ribonuclease BN (tRNA processing enzyme)